jgi:hypothetical protein
MWDAFSLQKVETWSRLICLLAVGTACWLGTHPGEAAEPDLWSQFQDPPKEYSLIPYWAWVEEIEPERVREQIREMVRQRVYGAYVFGFWGLRTPYLSPEWMEGMRAALEEGKERQFMVGFITDYLWPQGEYRDPWNLDPPVQSRVTHERPQYARKRLACVEKTVAGPAPIAFEGLERPTVAAAAKLAPDGALIEETLQVLAERIDGERFQWHAPEGNWRVMVFCVQDGGRVHAGWGTDLLSREAVAYYIDRVLGQHERQLGAYFGDVITSVVSDHEGVPMTGQFPYFWTPELPQAFARIKGYRLAKFLPLLFHEGGKHTEKVRCDYLDVLAELYAVNYWDQVSQWLGERQVLLTGHEWEETLLHGTGDLMRIQRHMTVPGIDSLWERGRSCRDFKETASVAHFLQRPFWCENQILQGADSFISPEKLRYGTNAIGAWGPTLLTPWFSYGKDVVNFPPVTDWRQPWWPQFHCYADYARRISFMNAQGHHVAPALLYYPITTVWANSLGPQAEARKRKSRIDLTEAHYTGLMNRLVGAQWDFDVTDDHFLNEAQIGAGTVQIGPESFRALILPPTTAFRRSAFAQIQEFYAQGGLVVATGSLPTISMEDGRDDPELARMVQEVFGQVPEEEDFAANENGRGGRAFFVKKDLAKVIELLDAEVPKDFKVLAGPAANLYYSRRVQPGGQEVYWVVNDMPETRENVVLMPVSGKPEKWDAADGSRSPLFHTHTAEGTKIRLHLGPWDAHFVVIAPGPPQQTVEPVNTNLEDYHLETTPALVVKGTAPASERQYRFEGRDADRLVSATLENPNPVDELALGEQDWTFQPLAECVQVPYARTKLDPAGSGVSEGWHSPELDDADWDEQWLSPERFTITQWLVLGPFDGGDPGGHAYTVPFGPELDGARVDVAKGYPGPNGSLLRWRRLKILPGRLSQAVASSDWGPNNAAGTADDGIADANNNYWQTRQGEDKGAWWQRNLGELCTVQAIRIAWARYEDKVHCPPARIEVHASPTGADGSWQKLLEIGPPEIPADGQPYDAKQRWRYPLPASASAKHVRLTFPEGGQPKARFPGYLCLGEVEIETREPLPAAEEGAPEEAAEQPLPWVIYAPAPRGPSRFGLVNDVFAYATYVAPIFSQGRAAYFATFVYSPDERTVQVQIASENARVWVNGRQLLSFCLPGYLEDRAGWAHKRDVSLHEGWNEILLKLTRPRHPSFYFRLASPDGRPMRDLVVSTSKSDASPPTSPPLPGFRWYRAMIPPGTIALKVPKTRAPVTVYVAGQPQPVENGLVQFPKLDATQDNLLALQVANQEEIGDYLQMVSGPVRYRLGCWTTTALANYSGAARYEKDFSLTPQYRGKRLMLDLGEVGVTAEVWVNGKRIGERAWTPFRLDITDAVRPGANHLKVVVRNTEANARAVESHRPLLKNINLNGLHGPVRILPYVELSLPLKAG